jgi:hypothetical protein
MPNIARDDPRKNINNKTPNFIPKRKISKRTRELRMRKTSFSKSKTSKNSLPSNDVNLLQSLRW